MIEAAAVMDVAIREEAVTKETATTVIRRAAASNMVTMAARRRLPWTERGEDDNP